MLTDGLRARGLSDWTHLWVGLRSIAELSSASMRTRLREFSWDVSLTATTAHLSMADAERLADRVGAERLSAVRRKGSGMTAAEVMRFARAEIDRAVENV